MHSPNLVDKNIEKIAEIFPNCITEVKGKDGEIVNAIDFELLQQESVSYTHLTLPTTPYV